MKKFLEYFKDKKNLTTLLIMGILILGIHLSISTLQDLKIIKSQAAGDPVKFTGDNVKQKSDGTWVAKLDSDGKAKISLELVSPLGPPASSTLTMQSKNSYMSLLPKGLVGIVYAGHDNGCGATNSCPTKNYCDGNTLFRDEANGSHTGVQECSNGCEGGACKAGSAPAPAKIPSGQQGCCDTKAQCPNNQECSIGNGSCASNKSCDPKSGNTSGGGVLPPGTVVTPTAEDASKHGGCCTGSGQGNCRSWELCDIANGSCGTGANGFSCRSVYPTSNCDRGKNANPPSSCCARDTDCGWPQFNKHCEGGICLNGPPNNKCQSAGSLEPRFSVKGVLVTNGTAGVGEKVSAAVYRNGTGEFAGAIVNNDYTPTDVSATITGPNGFNPQTVKVGSGTDFTFTIPGDYKLKATCGTLAAEATLTVATILCPTIGFQAPGYSAACANCITRSNTNVISTIKNGNKEKYNICTDAELVNFWCNGGVSQAGVTECQALRTGSGACASVCSGQEGPGHTATPNPSASSGSPAAPTTVGFIIAENPTDLDKLAKEGKWQLYTSEPMTVEYEFKDKTPGQKFIYVRFIDSNNTVTNPTNCPKCPANKIKLLGADPTVTSCSLSFEGNNTILNLKGQNFGSAKGGLKSNETDLTIREWKDTSVKAARPNTAEDQSVPVLLTNIEGQTGEGQCSAISQLALGAKVFCRAPSSHDTDNMDLTLVGTFEGGKKLKQRVKIDKEGVIQGLSAKLEAGKTYKLSLKAPKSLRKISEEFTAAEGTTNIPDFALPVGDIFPADGGDGKINSLDHDELVRQWNIAGEAGGRSADFNKDGRVNSVDWACMRYDFGDSDNEEPAASSTQSTGVGSTAGNTGVGSTVR